MNRTQLEALTDLIKALEDAEQDAGMFLSGSVNLLDVDRNKIAELDLLGTNEHKLVVA